MTFSYFKEKSDNNLKIPFLLLSDRRSDNAAREFPKFSDLYRGSISSYYQIFSLIVPFPEIMRQLQLIKAKRGSGVIFARLTHIKVLFIAEQPFLWNAAIAPCQKVIELQRSAVGQLHYRNI